MVVDAAAVVVVPAASFADSASASFSVFAAPLASAATSAAAADATPLSEQLQQPPALYGASLTAVPEVRVVVLFGGARWTSAAQQPQPSLQPQLLQQQQQPQLVPVAGTFVLNMTAGASVVVSCRVVSWLCMSVCVSVFVSLCVRGQSNPIAIRSRCHFVLTPIWLLSPFTVASRLLCSGWRRDCRCIPAIAHPSVLDVVCVLACRAQPCGSGNGG